jgi:hypothetical protein
MNNNRPRLTLGAIAGIFVAAAVAVIYALRWVGSNAHTINNGIGTVFGVLAFAIVLAGGVCFAIWLVRNRHLLVKRAAPAPAPAIQMQAQQVPAPGAVSVPGLAPSQVPALLPGQVPALLPGQVPGLPAGAAGPLVIVGLDHSQIGAMLRNANLAAADTNTDEEGGASG